MADKLSQTRTVLIEICSKLKRFRHKRSGYINESKLARALGVRPSTVHRILHLKRKAAEEDYAPSPRLLRGIMSLSAAQTESEALEEIENAQPLPPNIVNRLVRTRSTRK